jgi:hypothetical protein
MSENKIYNQKKCDEIFKKFNDAESLIREHIRELVGYEKRNLYSENIYYDPDCDEIVIKQDDGSWYENDNRIYLAKIKPGIADWQGVDLMEIAGVDTWNDFDDFEDNEEAQFYINNLIDEEYEYIESMALENLKDMGF